MIVLTGGAGFIGSCILGRLNQGGRTDVIVVDHLDDPLKEANLKGKTFIRYADKADFIEQVTGNELESAIECVIHMGACSSTTLTDADYYRQNNLEYSRKIARWCCDHGVRLIYASSAATYGDGERGYSDRADSFRNLRPLNLYGKSKHDFDLWVIEHGFDERFVGLKFFNVYGPNEYHKQDMRSVVCKAYPRLAKEGKIGLFKSYRPDYADGEQKRDFIYVTDAVDIVMFFLENPGLSGIYNVGTGQARSWNDVARAMFAAVGKRPNIEYIEMPEDLRSRYQYFTRAEMDKLREAGYKKAFTSLEDGIADYISYLKDQRHL